METTIWWLVSMGLSAGAAWLLKPSASDAALTNFDQALEVVAKRHPALRPAVSILEKAEHDGALQRALPVLLGAVGQSAK